VLRLVELENLHYNGGQSNRPVVIQTDDIGFLGAGMIIADLEHAGTLHSQRDQLKL
jgi:hypothetical protein